MKPLTLKMKALEAKAQDLLAEIKNLKNLVDVLETENAKLRHQLIIKYDTQPGGGNESVDNSRVTGRQNLANLYHDGFHVCNIHFGQLRESECLFCVALMRRGRGD